MKIAGRGGLRRLPGLLCAFGLAGCTGFLGIAPPSQNAELVQGPAIEDVVTPFDEALMCLSPHIAKNLAFAVGAVLDNTGRETYTDGGTGKFVTQGAGDMVQSALFRAGAQIVNRRNMDIPINEVRWGIRQLDRQKPTDFFISGSVNSLDFIPGGGFAVEIAGIGPRYRQNRILIALDLYMTDAHTGRVVASVPLQKQLFGVEFGVGVGRFFGNTLVSADAGAFEREALNFALRNMLNLATFELLAQRMDPRNYIPCRYKLDEMHGAVRAVGTGAVSERLMGALEDLRATDPVQAEILEREMQGEQVDAIIADLRAQGLMPPEGAESAPGVAPETVAPETLDLAPPPAAALAPAEAVEAPVEPPVETIEPVEPDPAAPAAPAAQPAPAPTQEEIRRRDPDRFGGLPVRIGEHERFTRVVLDLPPEAQVRWGVMDGVNLVVVVLSPERQFRLPANGQVQATRRVTGLLTEGNDQMQALQIVMNCECGAKVARLEDGRLVLDIAEGAPRPDFAGLAPERRPNRFAA